MIEGMTHGNRNDRIQLRSARRAESRTIAELYRMSSDGVADYIWSQLAKPGEDVLDIGARRYARENTDFSYQNVTLALVNGRIAGMIAAYVVGPSATDAPDVVDAVLAPYMKLEQPNSFYISGMALFPEFRRRGVGTRLLKLAADDARARGLRDLSLIVFEQNARAKRLYERFGFRETRREPIVPHPLIHHDGDALLMVCRIG